VCTLCKWWNFSATFLSCVSMQCTQSVILLYHVTEQVCVCGIFKLAKQEIPCAFNKWIKWHSCDDQHIQFTLTAVCLHNRICDKQWHENEFFVLYYIFLVTLCLYISAKKTWIYHRTPVDKNICSNVRDITINQYTVEWTLFMWIVDQCRWKGQRLIGKWRTVACSDTGSAVCIISWRISMART